MTTETRKTTKKPNPIAHLTKTHPTSAVGTGLQGYVKTSYLKLLETFGAPSREGSPDNKITVEWVLRVGNIIATIYDYKGDCPINGAQAEWHVGGTKDALEIVAALTGCDTRVVGVR